MKKAKAQLDKVKSILCMTLPVLPLETPLPPPTYSSDFLPSTEGHGIESDVAKKMSSLSCDEAQTLPPFEATSPEGCNLPLVPSLNAPVTVEKKETVAQGSCDADVAVLPSSAGQSKVEDLSSKKRWMCPPFTYRQDNDVVVFCLDTSDVKKQSVVHIFDDHFVSVLMLFIRIELCSGIMDQLLHTT